MSGQNEIHSPITHVVVKGRGDAACTKAYILGIVVQILKSLPSLAFSMKTSVMCSPISSVVSLSRERAFKRAKITLSPSLLSDTHPLEVVQQLP